jgi:hypothetical protein
MNKSAQIPFALLRMFMYFANNMCIMFNKINIKLNDENNRCRTVVIVMCLHDRKLDFRRFCTNTIVKKEILYKKNNPQGTTKSKFEKLCLIEPVYGRYLQDMIHMDMCTFVKKYVVVKFLLKSFKLKRLEPCTDLCIGRTFGRNGF